MSCEADTNESVNVGTPEPGSEKGLSEEDRMRFELLRLLGVIF